MEATRLCSSSRTIFSEAVSTVQVLPWMAFSPKHSRTRAAGIVLLQCAVAWVCACLLFQVGSLFL